MKQSLDSIAIAGAWGYIGRKLLDAALRLGIKPYVLDPGPVPADINPHLLERVSTLEELCSLKADLFHLALHPDARHQALEHLLSRGLNERLFILNEKPMVPPDQPREGPRLMERVEHSQAVMLFDFPEIFDPLTHRIKSYLAQFRQVELTSITVQRSKDREDPAISRNRKLMLPIQFQESVHCLAFVLYFCAVIRGGYDAVFSSKVALTATAQSYSPPNPEDYPYVVDGRCEYQLCMGPLIVKGLTNFKRGAEWTKRRILRGVADGNPFVIEADYFEGAKYLKINGQDQGWGRDDCSYEAILNTIGEWQTLSRSTLLHGIYPNPQLAWLAFQLSGALWKSSHEGTTVELEDLHALNNFDSGFHDALASLPRYP